MLYYFTVFLKVRLQRLDLNLDGQHAFDVDLQHIHY